MITRKPDWIRATIPGGETYRRVKKAIGEQNLHTVCTEAGCPNIGECFNAGTATFLIMGRICTRNCRYCAVGKGLPEPLDTQEPVRVGRAVIELGLSHAVITSVTRDDLPDGGAGHFAATITAIRQGTDATIELLVPDFKGGENNALQILAHDPPDVFNHNIEVVEGLFPELRPGGNYRHSLDLLSRAAEIFPLTKSGLMVGLGETDNEIETAMRDLHANGVSILTIGQYLQSARTNQPVIRYYTPDDFKAFGELAGKIGFSYVESSPLTRSSYHAGEHIRSFGEKLRETV